MIEFGAPWVFWALGPVYVLWVGLWLFAQFKKRDGAVRFSSLNELFLPAAHGFVFLRLLTRALRVAALGLLLFALARPQLRAEEAPIYSEGIDIMLALDTSASMNAVDLDADKPIRGRRTRLEVVKDVVREFVARRPADQVGMVVFGTWAYTQCPLTLDHAILNNFLVNLQIGIAGRSTAIGDAIGIGVKRLRKSEAKSRVMILLTDGENNSGKLDPQKAAEIAKTFGIRIYTIGAGTRGDAPVIDQGILGPRVGRMRTSIDDEALQKIADTTGGIYFRAEDVKSLTEVYDQIDSMEKSSIERSELHDYQELYPRYVGAAILLLLLEWLIMGTRLRAIP